MADLADEALMIEAMLTDIAIQAHRGELMPFTGQCRWCGCFIDSGSFCEGDSCAEDYSRRLRADKNNGRS
ncbi:MAG: hypothetical protein XXXJIFNMEKO3_01950 [Candidatus Erwinia impunctatus]|nr:hypothetical protein XXXJIFNMEKO_01950 [Culicoides impunctatus]